MFAACWTFRTAPAVAGDFAAAYGPEGEWVRLMRRSPGYLGTEALQDRDDPLRFLLLDRWTDEAAFLAFRRAHEREYLDLDQRCLSLTSSEEKVGHFRPWDGRAPAGPAPDPGRR